MMEAVTPYLAWFAFFLLGMLAGIEVERALTGYDPKTRRRSREV